MSHDSRKHRNGTRVQVLPAEERVEPPRPNNVRAVIVNSPDIIVYGVTLSTIVFGVVFLAIGGAFIKKCELQPLIPLWLLVLGVIITAGGSWAFFYAKSLKKEPFKRTTSMQKLITIALVLVFIGWFIAGHIWVYKGWAEDPDFGHTWFENGCNKSLFFMSFVAMIVLDCMTGIALIGICFWGLAQVIVKE